MNNQGVKLTVIILLFGCCVMPLFSQSKDLSSRPPLRNDFIEHGTFIHILGPNPIVHVGEEGAWDDRILEAGNIFKDGDTYYFYYHAQGQQPDQQGYRIGVLTANSPLGPFKRYGDKPIIDLGGEGAWDGKNVACPAILKEGENNLCETL